MSTGRIRWGRATNSLACLCLSAFIVDFLPSRAQADGWKAGVGRVAITPKQSMWMAGYGARNKPSEGALHDLWAKALVLEDPAGTRAAIVTLDICGIDRTTSNDVRDALQSKHDLPRSRIVLACSHTHTGPVVGTNLLTMYPLDDGQRRLVEDYTATLKAAILESVDRAWKDVAPVELAWANGRADFAVNRRNNDQPRAAELRERIELQGPVDHDVPVLLAKGADGKPLAIVCGYACHCTVLPIYQFSGDYAGFAQIALEQSHPGAQAMFVAGCGADQNPLPRGTVEHARKYGEELAEAVDRVLSGPLRPVSGPLASNYEEIDLAFGPIPDRAHWEAEARSKTLAVANRAEALLKVLDGEGRIPTTYPYPVQVWRLGGDLTWIFLGGEVVVDYSLRLKRNLGGSHTWVSAYCNDVMAYIPSLRVLKEGGYEGGGAMVYYGLPAPWSERVEEQIIGALRDAIAATRRP